MGNGKFEIGNRGATRRLAQTTTGRREFVELEIDGRSQKASRDKMCGAMSEQYGQGGRYDSAVPQGFVRLVGCRDPKASARPGARLHPILRKP